MQTQLDRVLALGTRIKRLHRKIIIDIQYFQKELVILLDVFGEEISVSYG